MHNRIGRPTALRATLNSTLSSGGDEFRFKDVAVATDVPGRAGRNGLVEVSGELLYADKPFGKCVLRDGTVVIESARAGTLELAGD